MRLKENIRATDVGDIESSLSSMNRGVKYLLYLLNVSIKFAWVKTLKNKKPATVINGFIKIANESSRKPNKLWVDQGKKICNSFIQKWFNDNDDISMYSTYSEHKSVISEKFITTLKCNIYEKLSANGNKYYLDHLNKLIEKYNKPYDLLIDKKPIDAYHYFNRKN